MMMGNNFISVTFCSKMINLNDFVMQELGGEAAEIMVK